jgi:hypothetical protein
VQIAYNTLTSSDRARVRALTEDRDLFESMQLIALGGVLIAAVVAGAGWDSYIHHYLQPATAPLGALVILFAMGVGPVAFISMLINVAVFGYLAHKAKKEIRMIENHGRPVAPLTGKHCDREADRRRRGQRRAESRCQPDGEAER